MLLCRTEHIYCTRKISRITTGGKNKKNEIGLIKNYAVDAYKNAEENKCSKQRIF